MLFSISFQKLKSLALIICMIFLQSGLFANNGKIGYAYPISNITIDGDLSDWTGQAKAFPINEIYNGGETRAKEDISATIQFGYNLEDQHVYVAVVATDDHFVLSPEDPLWFKHDLQVLYIDPKHSPLGSGVVSYEITLDTQKIVHQADFQFYPQIKNASWDDVEMKIKRKGQQTIYEWKIFLGEHVKAGRTVGFDYVIMDKDPEEDNYWLNWGPVAGNKHGNYKNVGDLILMPPKAELCTIKGKLKWEEADTLNVPNRVRLTNQEFPELWVQTQVDSNGNYQVELPKGSYTLSFDNPLVYRGYVEAFRAYTKQPITVVAKENSVTAADMMIAKLPKPGLLPEKGILHDFNVARAKEVDQFIETYRDYYGIPGVSLALIKDGKLAYHNTYGYSNMISKEEVGVNTLFEAASLPSRFLLSLSIVWWKRASLISIAPYLNIFPLMNGRAGKYRLSLDDRPSCAASPFRPTQLGASLGK